MVTIQQGERLGVDYTVENTQPQQTQDIRLLTDAPYVIPSSGLKHQYDWSDSSTTTSIVPDLAGSDDLSGTFTDLTSSINNTQAGNFDGGDDQVFVSLSSSVSTPVWSFIVARLDNPNSGNFETVTDGENDTASNDNPNLRSTSSDNFNAFAGNSAVGGGSDNSNNHIFALIATSSGLDFRIDGTVVGSNSNAQNAVDNLSVGSTSDGGRYGDWTVGEVLVYDGSQSSTISEIESYLSDKWGVAV